MAMTYYYLLKYLEILRCGSQSSSTLLNAVQSIQQAHLPALKEGNKTKRY